MSQAIIKLAPVALLGEFLFDRNQAETIARRNLAQYTSEGTLTFEDLEGEQVAEEVFDLTNNPCRQDERERLYGRGRSVSVGDVVAVDGVDYFCASTGWRQLL